MHVINRLNNLIKVVQFLLLINFLLVNEVKEIALRSVLQNQVEVLICFKEIDKLNYVCVAEVLVY